MAKPKPTPPAVLVIEDDQDVAMTITDVVEERGYRVLRFTNAEIMQNMDGVLGAILIALGRDPDDPLSPTLPPDGWEGAYGVALPIIPPESSC